MRHRIAWSDYYRRLFECGQFPYAFVLLNNGITIVCEHLLPANRKLKIKNPQIVNGCQTCSELFNAAMRGDDISQVVVSVKIIATTDDDLINSVIQGTNRQNIVYDEAFEVTKEFHKLLEEFFHAMNTSREDKKKIYYERRSKQYADNPRVSIFQKINFKILAQGFVSIFIEKPEIGFIHELKILQIFRDKIFIDSQSLYPYYVASAIFLRLEYYFRRDQTSNETRTYKSHVALIFRVITAGLDIPDINNSKKIENYCLPLIDIIFSEKQFKEKFINSVKLFNEIKSKWIEKKGENSQYRIKDNSEFTRFLLNYLSSMQKQTAAISPITLKNIGVVALTRYDRYGRPFGFISKNNGNIFFHSNNNPRIDFSNLAGKKVLYDIIPNPRDEQSEIAINIELQE